MAITAKEPTKEVLHSEILDFDFTIGKDGKTLKFNDHKSKQKEFEIYQYAEGKSLYIKK